MNSIIYICTAEGTDPFAVAASSSIESAFTEICAACEDLYGGRFFSRSQRAIDGVIEITWIDSLDDKLHISAIPQPKVYGMEAA